MTLIDAAALRDQLPPVQVLEVAVVVIDHERLSFFSVIIFN
jgi:hypothetical protein